MGGAEIRGGVGTTVAARGFDGEESHELTAWNEKLLMMYDFSYSDSVRWFSQSVRTRATYLCRGERRIER